MDQILQIFLRHLAVPEKALFYGVLVISIVAIVTYLLLRCRSNTRNFRFAVLIGELAVAAGVIGIIGLAGKTYIEFANQDISDSIENTRSKLDNLTAKLETTCERAAHTASSTKMNNAFTVACDIFKKSQQDYLAHKNLERLAVQYEQISKMDTLDPSVADIFKTARVEGEALSDLYRKSDMHDDYENRRKRQPNWPLVFLCALSVAFGAGVKCGRALAELVKDWNKVDVSGNPPK